MSRVRPGGFTNNNPVNMMLVTFSTACFWDCVFTNHAHLRSNWSNLTIPYMIEAKGSAKCSPPPTWTFQVHVCTHVPYFPNATKATQFSGSRHFQVCLPAPWSSCLFLPTTLYLALVVIYTNLYLPYLYVLCFHFASSVVISKISCHFSLLRRWQREMSKGSS